MLGSLPLGGQGVGGEPQELGSDIVNAILVSGESGHTVLENNNSASPGPNEPPNNGAPVWFYWQRYILTHPIDNGAAGFTDQRLTEVRMRFGVRYRPFLTGPGQTIQATQTNFPTQMTVFKALRWPVTGYGDLQPVSVNPPYDLTTLSATRYAYWEDQSQVQFDTSGLGYDSLGRVGDGFFYPDPTPTTSPSALQYVNSLPGQGYYYIRVDSALLTGGGIKRGNFVLWWEMADKGYKPSPLSPFGGGNGCAFCAPATAQENGACLLTFQVPIHGSPPSGQPFFSVAYPQGGGNASAATYVMTYCGGSWNYYYGWAVGQVPPGAVGGFSPPWTPNPPYQDPGSGLYYFFYWTYANGGAQTAHFDETIVSSGTDTWSCSRGYKSAALAEDRMGVPSAPNAGCPQVFFAHDGTSPIVITFTDAADGNSPGPSGPPVYTLARVVPVFEAFSVCGSLVSGNTYDVSFTFLQDINTNFFNVTCTCLLQGGVTASNTLTGRTIYADSPFNRSIGASPNTFTLRITVDPTLHKQVIATLQFTDFSGVLGTLAFDLAPYVVILNETSISAASCPAYALGEFFQFQVRGLPADNLTLQIDPQHTATSAIANSSCALTTTFNFGGVGCSGNGLVFYFNHLGNGVTTLPLYWSDGTQSLPPSVLSI